jgi:hypothetical protein
MRAVAAAVASTVLVAGCGGSHPGAAAVLDGYRIPMEAVDEQAAALCAVGPALVMGAGEGEKVEGRTFRSIVVGVQVQLRQAELAAEELGLDVPSTQASAEDLASIGVPVEDLSQAEIDALLDFYDDNTRTRALSNAIAERLSEDSGAQDQALVDETVAFLEAQVDEVEIDPRLGLDAELDDTLSGGSVSVPVSEAARAPSAEDPVGLQSFVSGLPAEQSCG